ncbi:MAG TPA: lipoxygenase family protein, partial [Polyangiales bacterium]
IADAELQAWVGELTASNRAAFQGMGGLVERDGARYIESREYLVDVVAQIIYTAGPLHASVNYPQYALGSYAPSVAASSYHAPPTALARIGDDAACLPWYLPLDVALYTISFEYLLSSVQYDRLGHYDQDPRRPYFDDPAVHDAVAQFQADLAKIETVIRQRNQRRPLPYPYQLPSQVPNSISI